MNYVPFAIVALVIVVCFILLVPVKHCMVDDRFLYGVSDMRQIYPEAGTVTCVDVASYSEARLTLWRYLKARRADMVYALRRKDSP